MKSKLFICLVLLVAGLLPAQVQSGDYYDTGWLQRGIRGFSIAGYLKADRSVALTGVTGPAALIIDADEKFATLDGVAVGQVLVSQGTTTAPAYSANPTLSGTLTFSTDGAAGTPLIIFHTAVPNTGLFYENGYAGLAFSYNGTAHAVLSAYGVDLEATSDRFGTANGANLYGDAAYTLDQRNSTNPQAFRIYGTYASATSYERAFLRTTATAGEIGTEKGSGGGTARPLNFYTDGILRAQIDTSGNIKHLGANSQATNIQQATAVVTTTAAATATATNLIPAGSFVIGVTTKVTTAVTGDAGFTGFNIGETNADRWGANVSPLLNATTNLTNAVVTAPIIFTSATSVVLTQVGGSTFNAGGVVRITVHYISLTAPTT